jgi:cell division protein FtsW (lipid II flippase)
MGHGGFDLIAADMEIGQGEAVVTGWGVSSSNGRTMCLSHTDIILLLAITLLLLSHPY